MRHSDQTQAQYVRVSIEQEITLGRLRPGQRIEESVLAEMFGTSRTPVREAVAQLVSSGLIRKEPRQGAVVAKLDLGETLALVEYSAELAAACARFAARRMNQADLAGLRAICERLEEHAEGQDVAAYATDGALFHTAIIDLSRNVYLIETVKRAVIQLASYHRFHLTYPGSMRRDVGEHREMIAAFERQDCERARMLMRSHAMLHPDVILDYFAFLDGGEICSLAETLAR